jgi:hypothetical protein
MQRRLEFRGKTGALYAYRPLEGEPLLRAAAANFVIASPAEQGWRVWFAGETDNLARGAWRAPLEKAQKKDAAAICVVRLNVTRSQRTAELQDLLDEHAPPLNGRAGK